MITNGRFKARRTIMLGGALLLSGCNAVVLDPSGDVAIQQRNLVLMSTALMLLIIIPVMALTVFFAWHYRESNKRARYEPEWHHSTQLELVIWAAPLLIIICLGALTWMGTHILDPYRQIARLEPGRPMPAGMKPLQVDVVALDWKWLFIYPELGVATVNELAAPANRPIDFRITSATVMNSFYVPALAGQIYAMPGMETKLHAVINKPGDYDGFSANYSGAGFSGMHFRFHGLSDAEFAAWVDHLKQNGAPLNRAAYLQLERPSEDEPVRFYASVAPDLYHAVLNLCVEAGKMCMDDMMRIDAKGGMGLAGVYDVLPLAYDKYAGRGSRTVAQASYFVASICNTNDRNGTKNTGDAPRSLLSKDVATVGAGLPPPGLVSQGLFSRPLRPRG
jgi:cytochrome o ubiquinol oxidase subunit 2